MKDEPDIVKELREAENIGLFQSKVQSAYEELEMPKESSEESLDKTTYMVDGDLKRARDDIEIENIGEKYRTIFENYAIAITMADEKERIVSWNKYAEELLSMSEKDLYLKPVSSLYPSEEWKKIRAENIRKKGIKYRMETKMIRNNQELFDVELSLCVLKGAKGKTVGSIGIVKDITKQKEMKKALEKSEGKFRQLYEKAPVPYHTLSPSGTITNVNETWCQTLGYSRKEVIGRSIFDFIIEDEQKSAKSSFEKKILSKQSYSIANERVYVTKDGANRTLVIHDFFSFDGDNNVESVYTIMDDVTELKKVEEEMKKHQEHLEKLVDERTAELKKINEQIQQESMTLVQAEKGIRSTAAYTRSLIEASLDPLVTIGPNGMITDVNESTEKVTGRTREELIGSDFSGYFTEPTKAKEGYKQVFEKGVVRDYPLEIRHKNGSTTSVLYNASVYKDESGKIIGIFASARDITGRKLAEEKIQQQNIKLKKLNSIKSVFLNVTSHELRTPLSGIKGYVQMTLDQAFGKITDEQKDALELILQNTDHLNHIVQDILDSSQIQAGTMKFVPNETNIEKMVNEAVNIMQSSAKLKEIKITSDIKPNIPELFIDSDRIKQVVTNLIGNAIKFSPENTIIDVRARKEENNVKFELQDQGRGIPKDKQKKIFEMFYQVDQGLDRQIGGVGLGLAISMGILSAHGGKINVESPGPGKGSTFSFTLPIESVKDIEKRFKDIDLFGTEK